MACVPTPAASEWRRYQVYCPGKSDTPADPLAVSDTVSTLLQLTKRFLVIDDRLERGDKIVEEMRKEIAELRKENAKLSERVATREEGRKTVAAEVKMALTQTLSELENQRLRKELDEEKAKNRRIAPKEN